MKRNNNQSNKPLTSRIIAAIFTDRQRSQYQIAEQYSVSQSMVSLIRSGKRWGHLTKHLPLYRREDYRHTNSGRRRLTQPQVRDIYCSGLPIMTLADAYKIDRRTVERIRTGSIHIIITQHLTRSTSWVL
jgi:DNA-binding Xre family transcriptional regulator